MGHGVTGKRVHHQQYVLALILKVLRDSRSRHGTFISHHRGLVGSRNNKHGTRHALFAQIPLNKFKNLSAALSHKSDDVYIRLNFSCDHTQQRGFANARTRENTHSLTSADCKQTVYGFYTERDYLVYSRSCQRVDRFSRNGVAFSWLYGSPPVYGLTDSIYDPAHKRVPHAHLKLSARVVNDRAGTNALYIGIRHKHDFTVVEAYDFSVNKPVRDPAALALAVNAAHISNVGFGTRSFNGHANYLFNFALISEQIRLLDGFAHSCKIHIGYSVFSAALLCGLLFLAAFCRLWNFLRSNFGSFRLIGLNARRLGFFH